MQQRPVTSRDSKEDHLTRWQPSLIAACTLISCAPVNGVNEDHQLAVVNAVLVSGQSTQSLTVMWAGTSDDPYPPNGPSAADVNLWITSTAGDSVAVAATGRSGVYAIALTPQPGVTYRLRGTILGAPVVGNTTVPALAISLPAPGDTLIASQLDIHHAGLVQFTPHLVASGAGGFGVRSTQVLEGQQGYLTNFTAPLSVIYHGPAALPVHADVIAFDSNAAKFYGVIQDDEPGGPVLDGRIPGTIAGALGFFGSSTSASIDIVIVP